MKYLALLFALVFLLFAGWQYNDPDPLLWGAVYLIAAYVSFRAFQGRVNHEMLVVLLVWSAAWAISSWSQMTSYEGFFTQGEGLSMKTPNQELAREASGLGIVAVAYAIFLVGGGKGRAEKKPVSSLSSPSSPSTLKSPS